MIGLLLDRPRRGKGGYRNVARLAESFDDEFNRWCCDIDKGRSTPEKRLQSFLLSDAHSHDSVMTTLCEASQSTDDSAHLELFMGEMLEPMEDV